MKRFLFIAVAVSLALTLASPVVLAGAGLRLDNKLRPQSAPTISGDPDEKIDNFDVARNTLTQKVVNVVVGVAGVVAVYFIVNSGFALVISGGSEEAVTQHKKALTWAVVGLILIILSYSIITFVIRIALTADEGPKAESAAPAAPVS